MSSEKDIKEAVQYAFKFSAVVLIEKAIAARERRRIEVLQVFVEKGFHCM